eukprot:symbB.v1.2.000211.t4/scaffold21.1/size436794/30
MSTYCCTQFVVSRKRLERVPDAFWSIPTARRKVLLRWICCLKSSGVVWRSLHQRLSVNGTATEGSPAPCRFPAQRVYEQRTQRNGHTDVADFGLWGEVLERAWHWIFGEEPVLPSREADGRLPLFLRIPRVRTDVEGGPRGTLQDRVSLPDWGFDPGFWGTPPILTNVTGEAPRSRWQQSPPLRLQGQHGPTGNFQTGHNDGQPVDFPFPTFRKIEPFIDQPETWSMGQTLRSLWQHGGEEE